MSAGLLSLRVFFRPTHDNTIALRVAILQAFEQVGDSKALAVVERLAKREAKTVGEKRLQEAAEQCLPMLQDRVTQEQSSHTLLRASHLSSAAPDMLLRPAAGTHNVGQKQLLRATVSDCRKM